MSDPTNVSELARETIENLPEAFHLGQWEIDELEKAFQSALSKLAAEKAAEIARANKNEAYWRAQWKKQNDDLTRHVAALKVARDGLCTAQRTFLSYVTIHMSKTPPDITKASHNQREADCISVALQRIDKELMP